VYAVERLGFPYWTPYLAGKTKEDFRYGANLAVASGTALNQLFFKKKGLDVGGITPYSLGVQISWFQKLIATLGSTEHGMHATVTIISQACMFVVCPPWNYGILVKFLRRCLDWPLTTRARARTHTHTILR